MKSQSNPVTFNLYAKYFFKIIEQKSFAENIE